MSSTLLALALTVTVVAPPSPMTPTMQEAQAAHDAQLRLDAIAELQCGPPGTIHECIEVSRFPAAVPHRHPPAAASPTTPTNPVVGDRVGQWRGLVSQHVPAARVEESLRIIQCESGGDPNAYNPSTATGLFQIKTFWVDPSRAGNFAHIGTDLTDPVTNVKVMVAINESDRRGWWHHWQCKP